MVGPVSTFLEPMSEISILLENDWIHIVPSSQTLEETGEEFEAEKA